VTATLNKGTINMKMTKTLALAAVAALALSGHAYAAAGGEPNNTNCNGVGNPNSPCVPSAGGGSGGGNTTNRVIVNNRAQASARAASRAAANATAQGGRASAAGGSANVTVQGGGSGGGSTYVEARERQRVPDASAPAVWSNNPCLVGLSGGVAVAGFGASIGAGVEDRDCTRRANAQQLVAMGEREAAREVLCGSTEVRQAFARIGRPCVADQPARPATAGPVQAVVLPAPASAAPVAARPGYCATLRARGMVTRECE
jgi:hypothetical protein